MLLTVYASKLPQYLLHNERLATFDYRLQAGRATLLSQWGFFCAPGDAHTTTANSANKRKVTNIKSNFICGICFVCTFHIKIQLQDIYENFDFISHHYQTCPLMKLYQIFYVSKNKNSRSTTDFKRMEFDELRRAKLSWDFILKKCLNPGTILMKLVPQFSSDYTDDRVRFVALRRYIQLGRPPLSGDVIAGLDTDFPLYTSFLRHCELRDCFIDPRSIIWLLLSNCHQLFGTSLAYMCSPRSTAGGQVSPLSMIPGKKLSESESPDEDDSSSVDLTKCI